MEAKFERKYFIDWLRILLIISVFFYHIGMFYNGWGWHVKNETSYSFLHPIMSFLHIWRMPLLFLVSGAGTYFALRKRTAGQYVKERTLRLLVPLVCGIFLLVPVQVYLERIDSYSSLFSFYPHIFDGIYPSGNFSWHHLWFLVYLYLISLMIAPFLNSLRSWIQKGKVALFFQRRAAMNWILVALLLSQLLLRPIFPDSTHALFNDWAFFAMYFIYFFTGFMLVSQDGVVKAMERDRNIYLIQTILLLVVYYLPLQFASESFGDYFWGILSLVLAWSTGLAVLGYAKKYLNFNHSWRKPMNEAIYPFYLFHQPAILVIGYLSLSWGLTDGIESILLILLSLAAIIATYIIISQFNVTRVIFGLRPRKKGEGQVTEKAEVAWTSERVDV